MEEWVVVRLSDSYPGSACVLHWPDEPLDEEETRAVAHALNHLRRKDYEAMPRAEATMRFGDRKDER